MSKNKKMEERTRTLFIEAAKEILMGEGISCISARNVAERAGYSYATLYNYFKDMGDLVAVCLDEFSIDTFRFVENDTEKADRNNPVNSLKAKLHSLVKYYIQYPGIYDLFYLEKIGSSKNRAQSSAAVSSLVGRLIEKEWEAFCSEKKLNQREAGIRKDQLLFVFTGLMLLYQNRNYPAGYAELTQKLDEQVDLVINQAV